MQSRYRGFRLVEFALGRRQIGQDSDIMPAGEGRLLLVKIPADAWRSRDKVLDLSMV
jgi:hypothetical protein